MGNQARHDVRVNLGGISILAGLGASEEIRARNDNKRNLRSNNKVAYSFVRNKVSKLIITHTELNFCLLHGIDVVYFV